MSTFENAISISLVLLGAGGFVYGWFYFLKHMSWKEMGWGDRLTVFPLLLVSLTVLFWSFVMITKPTADWGSGIGVAAQMHWVTMWERVALRIELAALVSQLVRKAATDSATGFCVHRYRAVLDFCTMP